MLYLIAAQHDLKVVTLTALSKMLYLYYLTGNVMRTSNSRRIFYKSSM